MPSKLNLFARRALTEGFLGVVLQAIAILFDLISFFLGWYVTPFHGSWAMSEQPLLLSSGIVGFFLLPTAGVVGAFLLIAISAFIAIPTKISRALWRGVGVLATLTAVAAFAVAIYQYGDLYHKYFDNAIAAGSGPGFGLMMSSFVLYAAAGVLYIIFPVQITQEPVDDESAEKLVSHKSSRKTTKLPMILGVLSILVLLFVIAMIISGASLYKYGGAFSQLNELKVPAGFKLSVYADGVAGARSMALASINGSTILYVGSRPEGNLYALKDTNNDGVADCFFLIASGLNSPNGIATRDGHLFVAEIDKISKFENMDKILADSTVCKKSASLMDIKDLSVTAKLLTDKLPKDSHHGWRYVAFGPDGLFYIAVGSPCNICFRDNPIYSSILRQKNANSWDLDVFATGIRNTVGFDWHPVTQELWFTECGRDWLSNDAPVEELNIAPRAGLHYGFPWCYGSQNTPDPDISNSTARCAGSTAQSGFTASVLDMVAHATPIGARFYRGSAFPAEYRNVMFIAEHGSWNRRPISGFRVSFVRGSHLGVGQNITLEPFLDGFVRKTDTSQDFGGRPVDIMFLADGSMLVSDDYSGRIFRISV